MQEQYLRAQPAPSQTDANRKLIRWGWITTLLFAPVGAIIGIILITRNVIGHGIAQLLLSAGWLYIA
jgi:hypothetical protein